MFSVKSRSTSRTVGTVVLYVFQLPVVYEYESTISTITWEFGCELMLEDYLYIIYCLRSLWWLVTGWLEKDPSRSFQWYGILWR